MQHDMAPAVAVPAPLRMMDEPSALSQENKQLRAQVERLQAERDELRRKVRRDSVWQEVAHTN